MWGGGGDMWPVPDGRVRINQAVLRQSTGDADGIRPRGGAPATHLARDRARGWRRSPSRVSIGMRRARSHRPAVRARSPEAGCRSENRRRSSTGHPEHAFPCRRPEAGVPDTPSGTHVMGLRQSPGDSRPVAPSPLRGHLRGAAAARRARAPWLPAPYARVFFGRFTATTSPSPSTSASSTHGESAAHSGSSGFTARSSIPALAETCCADSIDSPIVS